MERTTERAKNNPPGITVSCGLGGLRLRARHLLRSNQSGSCSCFEIIPQAAHRSVHTVEASLAHGI